MRKIKCGVIGAGWWATYAHIPALKRSRCAELIAIEKRRPEEARRVAEDFGIPFSYTDPLELLSAEGLEAVVISSPPNVHYVHAKAALRAGKHVLIEKPMTFTGAEAEELVEMANAADLQFLISCPWHYTDHALQARQFIRQGELGEVRMISILMTNPVAHLIRGSSPLPSHGTPYLCPHLGTYSDPAVAGGGQIYTQVSHIAAYLTFLTGATARSVFARFHNDGAQLDIYDTLNVEMSDGSLVSIASTGATGMERRDYEVRVFGTRGMLFLELWRGKMSFIDFAGRESSWPDLSPEQIYPHEAPAQNLVESILDPSRNQSPATLGAAATSMIEAACLSARTGAAVSVDSLSRRPL